MAIVWAGLTRHTAAPIPTQLTVEPLFEYGLPSTMRVMAADLLLERGDIQTGYRLSTVSQSFDPVRRGEDPGIALGDFLDDWRRAEAEQRPLLIADQIGVAEDDSQRRWAALSAAVVDWPCWTSKPRLEAPDWLADEIYVLPAPWFVVEGAAMRTWQLVESPTPFRMRRIFADASIVARA